MTGPWSYISYLPSFGPQSYFVHIPSKFMGMATHTVKDATRPTLMARPAAGMPARADDAPALGARLSISELAASMAAEHVANKSALTQPLSGRDAERAAAISEYYYSYLSYSANFAGGYTPNPPGSGYHWSLQSMRFGLSAQFAARVASTGRLPVAPM
jgi:hypothetical protein